MHIDEMDVQFFAEDEISLLKDDKLDNKKYGLVIETAETGHDDIYIENCEERLALGLNKIWFPFTGETLIIESSKLKLEDRSILPGDLIKRLKSTIKGYSSDTKMVVSLQEINGTKCLTNIDTRNLIPIQYLDISEQDTVALDCWMGIVQSIKTELTLAFQDVALCKINSKDFNLDNVIDIHNKTNIISDNCDKVKHYISQVLKFNFYDLRKAKWIKSTKKHNSKTANNSKRDFQVNVTVINIRVVHFDVNWDFGISKKRPKRIVSGSYLNRLKKMDCFNAATYQLGDYIYCLNNNDNFVPNGFSYDKFLLFIKERNLSRYAMPEFENITPFFITKTESFIDVVWQDGSTEKNINSIELYPINYPDDNEYFPGDYVISADFDISKSEYAVVKKVNHEARTCIIQWFNNSGIIPEIKSEEEISVYDVKHHEEFNFRPGTIIIFNRDNLSNVQHVECVGQVKELSINGKLLVIWYHDYESEIYPTLVTIKYDSDNDFDFDSDCSSFDNNSIFSSDNDDSSWETDEEIEVSTSSIDNTKPKGRLKLTMNINRQLIEESEGIVDLIKDIGKENSLSIEILIDILENIVHKMLPLVNKCLYKNRRINLLYLLDVIKQQAWKRENIFELIQELGSFFTMNVEDMETSNLTIETITDVCQDFEKNIIESTVVSNNNSNDNNLLPGNVESIDDNETIITSDIDKNKLIFLENVSSDYFFINEHSETNSKFLKRYQSEIKKLSLNLPNGILIHAFEDNFHKLRAMIHGTRDTPYEDGLFFFDIFLPESYPNVPPLVHYHSMCNDRLNPNLYVDGKVCLSLLGTWSGTESEKWTSSSTLLQLFISFQSLILVEEPYFNEAGYELQRNTVNGCENSKLYNEMVLLLMTKSMTTLAKKIPFGFEGIVKDHIKLASKRFIARVQSWSLQDGLYDKPSYPLLPLTKGFLLAFERAKTDLTEVLNRFIDI